MEGLDFIDCSMRWIAFLRPIFWRVCLVGRDHWGVVGVVKMGRWLMFVVKVLLDLFDPISDKITEDEVLPDRQIYKILRKLISRPKHVYTKRINCNTTPDTTALNLNYRNNTSTQFSRYLAFLYPVLHRFTALNCSTIQCITLNYAALY